MQRGGHADANSVPAASRTPSLRNSLGGLGLLAQETEHASGRLIYFPSSSGSFATFAAILIAVLALHRLRAPVLESPAGLTESQQLCCLIERNAHGLFCSGLIKLPLC